MKKLRIFFPLFLCITFISCLKNSKEVGELEPLPIDGTWYAKSVPLNRIRIDKGRLFQLSAPINFFDPETVMLSSIKELSPGVYQGYDNSLIFPIKREIKVVRVNEIEFNNFTLVKESVDDEIAYNNLLYHLKYLDKKSFIEITLKYTREKVNSEVIEIPIGSTMKIKRARTLENRITYALNDVKGDISEKSEFSFSDGTLIKYLEEKYQHEVKQQEIIEHEITLDGNHAQKYMITWYDKLRNGQIGTYIKGEWKSIPFKFKEWSEIEVKAINE